jgi:hypothetical protein
MLLFDWSLVPHPASAWCPAAQLRVTLAPTTGGMRLEYTLEGDLAQLRLPMPAPPGPADGLWRHTCFEAFVAAEHGDSYREFNFSPSGQWAMYRFVRRRMPETATDAAFAPGMRWSPGPRSLRLTVCLPYAVLPAASGWRLGLSAVLEHLDGGLSYWALSHPGSHPDFHDPAGWRRVHAPAAPVPAPSR